MVGPLLITGRGPPCSIRLERSTEREAVINSDPDHDSRGPKSRHHDLRHQYRFTSPIFFGGGERHGIVTFFGIHL